jgi:hypothetical protein
MEREQLEALRRQVEEDYKLDIAAIERLLCRHSAASGLTSNSAPNSGASLSSYSAPSRWTEAESRIEPSNPVLPSSGQEGAKGDDLAGSIRTIFNGGRK